MQEKKDQEALDTKVALQKYRQREEQLKQAQEAANAFKAAVTSLQTQDKSALACTHFRALLVVRRTSPPTLHSASRVQTTDGGKPQPPSEALTYGRARCTLDTTVRFTQHTSPLPFGEGQSGCKLALVATLCRFCAPQIHCGNT